jgi:hypothetical protein
MPVSRRRRDSPAERACEKCRLGAANAAATACSLMLGCSSAGGSGEPDSGRDVLDAARDASPVVFSGDEFVPTYAPTYSAIYDEVLLRNCALVFCHAGTSDYLVITNKDEGYGALVAAPAQGPTCAPTGLKRVNPGHPESSLMYLKITRPPCGSKMPLVYGSPDGSLDPAQIDQIGQWIDAGAPNN